MSKKSTKALASATLMSLVLTTALSAGPVKAAQGPVTRVSGGDRYATAAKVATTEWTTTDNVVLVSGEGYADAVSASALAKKLGAPILLTTGTTLNSDAQSALDTLKPKNVYVVGGNASISQSIRDNLKAKYTLTELGGATRYATNVAVAKELVKLGVSASDVMVVGGQGFADALSVAPVAAAKGQILLLANNDQASTQGAIDFVKDNKSNVTIVGTTNVISDAIKSAFGSTATRVNGGSSRFDTNLAVLKAFSKDLKADKLYVANASAATPDNLYADALVASALAGKYTAPLVLVDKDGSDATNSAVSYIKSENAKEVDIIGGTSVVPQSIADAISGKVTPTNPEVSSISANGLNQIKFVFNQEVDQDTAEDVTNYKVNGTQLNSDVTKTNGATASLQDDNKTVLVTLTTPQDQNDNVTVKVNKGILTADKSSSIPEYSQSITFADTTTPTISSVTVRGNKKLDIKFSEPVKAADVSDAVSKLKINDRNLSSFGLNTSDLDGGGVDKLSKLDDETKGATHYTDEVELYFDSALTTGDNTLSVSDADGITLSDAAGFPIADTTQNFTVDTLTTAPKITSITSEDNGTVYVNFDRPMDPKTAKKASNFTVNGEAIGAATLKKSDTQIKITGADLTKNSNKLYINNKVKDAYGNSVEDDTYESFTLDQDTTKPAVDSVYALDDSTIRVKFSKDVDSSYAKSTSHYTLEDSDGTDITDSEINNIIIPGDNTKSTSNIFDIKLKPGYKLSDSKYTITIKGIQDKATTPNVMDSYTNTFNGSADVNAEVTGVYGVTGNNQKVTLTFNKAMDSSSLKDKANYTYKDKNGGTGTAIPSNSTITVSSDNKSVTIELPSSYTTYYTNGGTNVYDSRKDLDNQVYAIYTKSLKDEDGNELQTGSTGGDIQAPSSTTTSIKPTSVQAYYDNDDLKVKFAYDEPIDETTAASHFVAGYMTGSTFNPLGQASTASVDGNNVTLTFSSDTAPTVGGTVVTVGGTGEDVSDATTLINKIKAKGTKLVIEATGVKDILGNTLAQAQIPIYNNDAAPRTIVTKDSFGKVTNWTSNIAAASADVTVVFDTPIEASSVKESDFAFSINGDDINADSVSTTGNTVKFTFNNSSTGHYNKFKTAYEKSSTIKVTPTSDAKAISTETDLKGENAYYVPTTDDYKGISIVINAATPTVAPSGMGVTDNVGTTPDVLTGTAGATYTVNVYSDSDCKTLVNTATADGTGAFTVNLDSNTTGKCTYYVEAVNPLTGHISVATPVTYTASK